MLLSKLRSLLAVLEFKGAIRAFVTWPKFSIASFLIISRLKQAGVSPRTVIDLGANVGQFAVAAANLFDGAKILSVEPDPRVANQLKKNLDAYEHVEIFVTAMGDSVGNAEFFVNKDAQVSSMLQLGNDRRREFPQSTVVEKINVPVTTLDTFFLGRDLDQPILLKIDVQGFEDRVINGGKKFLNNTEWVVMEVSFADLYQGERDFESMLDLMNLHGFQFIRPLNCHFSPVTGQIIEMDALFQNKSKRGYP